jgi:hypothetical protein
MLRTLLLLVAFVVLIGLALVYFGVINVTQNGNGSVSVQSRSVEVGTTKANVQVPVVRTETRLVDVPSVAVGNGQGNSR